MGALCLGWIGGINGFLRNVALLIRNYKGIKSRNWDFSEKKKCNQDQKRYFLGGLVETRNFST